MAKTNQLCMEVHTLLMCCAYWRPGAGAVLHRGAGYCGGLGVGCAHRTGAVCSTVSVPLSILRKVFPSVDVGSQCPAVMPPTHLLAYSLHACGRSGNRNNICCTCMSLHAVSFKGKQALSAVQPRRCRRGAARPFGCLTMARTPTRPHGWLVWAPATLCATWLAASGPRVRLLAVLDLSAKGMHLADKAQP